MSLNPILIHAMYGAAGGLIGELVRGSNVLYIPQRVKRNGRIGWDIGCFGALLIGTFIGIVVDRTPAIAGLFGYMGAQGITYILEKFLPEFVHKPSSTPSEEEGGE